MIPSPYISVLSNFHLSAEAIDIRSFGEGHIHETYLVVTKDHSPDYILQEINHNIFKDIPGMMKDIEAATKHLRLKLSGMPGHDPGRESLALVYSNNGNSFYKDEDGQYWRMYVFVPGTVTHQLMTKPKLAAEAGRIIGLFQSLLSDLDAPLIDTIHGFHDINLRIGQFSEARSADPAGRVTGVITDICFAEQQFEKMSSYFASLRQNAVIRPTHNDTKLNNILFDAYGKALCLVDLDTIMPGYVHFDYGDALRTMANTALEDETDLTKVHFNQEIYNTFTAGYLSEADRFLTMKEKELLPYSPIYLTFIIGLRFLTDYLNGDIYFRIHRPGHNLDRAKVQFRLVEEMGKILIF